MTEYLNYLLFSLALFNVATFVAMGMDKRRADQGEWRIAERTFWFWAVLGGSLGVFLGMWVFRHKVKKGSFYWVIYLIMLVQLCLLWWWWWTV